MLIRQDQLNKDYIYGSQIADGIVRTAGFRGQYKGEKILKLYQYYTKVAKHYFCSICGIHTHNRPRINPKIYGINIACIDDIDTFALKDVPVNNGENHPLDQKK